MSAQHTPGPWHRNIKPAAKYPTIFAGRNTHVAVINSLGLTDEAVEANCDLIAGAPALLERALADAKVMSEIANAINAADPHAAAILRTHALNTRAAIAKATGSAL